MRSLTRMLQTQRERSGGKSQEASHDRPDRMVGGIAAGLAGILAAYYGRWSPALGLGLLAVLCAIIVLNPEK
jgi:hypothetical protein